jgi:hypothetical protein
MKLKQQTITKIQIVYYLLTGWWPIVHINSFMAVTGPKTDVWLVKMVGLLTIAIAIGLYYSLKESKKVALALGITAAISYTIIDVYYSLNNIISDIYLGDAVVEVLIIVLLIISGRK